MELVVALLLIGLFLAVGVSLVLAVWAWVRAERVKRFERSLSEYQVRLFGVEKQFAAMRERIDGQADQPAAEPTVPSTRREPSTPQKKTAEGAVPKRPRLTEQAPAPPPPNKPTPSIDWERWIGLRGAALLGAVALGLAGLLFFKYSIERGLISPEMRVVLGTLTGLGSLFASEWLRRRDYRHVADALAGAGVIILYAAFWAAHVLYGLIPMAVTFGLMVLVTAACCLLAVRRNSLVVAVLGFLGGFATPLLLSSGSDRPIGLFGYVLLLDLALLAVGHKRRWPSLTVLSLLGSMVLQTMWIVERMGPERLFLGLTILTVFGALFLFAGGLGARRAPSAVWLRSQIAALLFPFAFALYFAERVELGPHLYPIAMLLGLLCTGACWLAREQKVYPLGLGGSAASLAVVAVWSLGHELTASLAWELTLTAIGLAAIFHLFVERERERAFQKGPGLAAILTLAGTFVLTLRAATVSAVAPWPWLVAWTALAVLAYRQAMFPGRSELRLGTAVAAGLGLTVLHLAEPPQLPGTPWMLGLILAAPLALLAYASSRLGRDQALAPEAVSMLSVLLLPGLAISGLTAELTAFPVLGVMSLLGVLGALAATRVGSGGWYAAALAATAMAHYTWTLFHVSALFDRPAELVVALCVLLGTVLAATAWPFITERRFLKDRLAWYAAALVAPAYFHLLRRLFEWRFGDELIGVVPIALGSITLAAAFRAAKLADPAVRKSAVVWFAAVTLGFLALAIPLQLDREWVTLGWALQGLGMIALWKRLDHSGLKYFGLSLLALATARLVGNPAVLGYHTRGTMRIVNWLAYTYMVPAIALLGSARLLRPLELVRVRSWERGLYKSAHPLGAIGAGLAAVCVIFVWINLAIAEWYATGPTLTLSFGDTPAQRLTLSLAWALYALMLLALGVARHSVGLRWISLSFLLVTIAKVFLYDLGALEDLYRVASLVGLAVSLILVSLLYQRFVFRRGASEAT